MAWEFASQAGGMVITRKNKHASLKLEQVCMLILKVEVCNIPMWVKFHRVPITAFTEDGLSVIVTKIGTQLMLDTYTSAMYTVYKPMFKEIHPGRACLIM